MPTLSVERTGTIAGAIIGIGAALIVFLLRIGGALLILAGVWVMLVVAYALQD